MTEHTDYGKLLYNRAASTLRVHGILSIIFGGLGLLAVLLFGIVFALTPDVAEPTDPQAGDVFWVFFLLITFVFWVLPHIYFIVAGTYLIRQPSPKVAKTLVIINLVIGVFWNLVLLIFAIINLTEISDYERGYHAHRIKQ